MRIDKVTMSTKQTSPSSGKNKILYQVGARLEAMDFTLNWYAAKICRVDEKERKVLIHFEGWNHRYDEWIDFDSERLRPHARQPSHQDSKDEKGEVCDYQDWKVGDRVLAKWQDCKFYPAKIVKSLNDGAYEVLFYDGIKKTVHRVNIKPDSRKLTMMPADKLEHDREVQERKERRQLMATARAERARKRSAEVSPIAPVVPMKRREGRSKKGRTHERDESAVAVESSMQRLSGEVPEVDEVLQDCDNLIMKNEGVEPEAEQVFKTTETANENVAEDNTEKLSKEANIPESTFTRINQQTATCELKQGQDSSFKSVSGSEKGSTLTSEVKQEEEHSNKSQESFETALPIKEELKEDSYRSVDEQDSSEMSIKHEGRGNSSQDILLNVNSEQIKDKCKSVEEEEGKAEVVSDNDHDKVTDVKLVLQNTFPSVGENEPGKDASICDYNTGLHQEQTESLEEVTVIPKLESDNSKDSKPLDSGIHKLKTSKGPKIKRTLSKAERLSRARKAKSGLSVKMGLKSPLKVSLPAKRADNPEGSLTPKGNAKTIVKTEKTVQRRRSSKGSRSSSISPRGYGYSMAFMDMEKPTVPVVKPELEIEESIPDGGVTDTLLNSTPSMTCTVASPTSPASSTGTPIENPPAPKKHTYQAKKFRLDQITGKLSAQRQSEAQAAAHSPSAFQLAKHSSPPPLPPTLSPSPPANQPPPYPRESYPAGGPPPLIYSPMPRSCCPTPHHQHVYGAHPGHGMHLPASRMPPHPEYPPPSSGYMLYAHGMHYPAPPPPPPPPGPCIGQCSCSACVRQPIYHPLPPGANRPPRGRHRSALAQLMQCEQRILHAEPGMPHYREPAPPRPWVTHRHGPPPQPFLPVGHHPEDLWHAHEEPTLQAPPVSQATPPTSSISPTSDIGKNANRRSRKNERPLPTKALPASTLAGLEGSMAQSSTDLENATAEKTMVQQHEHEDESENMDTSKPEISDPSTKDTLQNKLESESKLIATSSQLPTVSAPVASVASSESSAVLSTMTEEPGMSGHERAIILSGFISVGKNRKGKEPAPKELIIEMDHNKYKCKVPGCDKSFRKESGLEYHIKYYHEQQAGAKRKKSISVRSDSTPETSPEFGNRRVTKRRIHRSSAPAQLASGSQVVSANILIAATSQNSEPVEPECSELFRSISMESEPSVNQDNDLEIEGGGVEVESIEPGMAEVMEVEEEEDINGDVIRCLCNETEEGGFMIQCEQCLTWQHSECVGLNEQTVPPNYLCYVCTNPRGLRRSAKYKNDFDWFRRGTLACIPFVPIEEPEYTAELNLATHGLMGDLHDVNNCLRSLKLKFELLRSPSHPDLKYWRKPKKNSTTGAVNTTDKFPAEPSTNTEDSFAAAAAAAASVNEEEQEGNSNRDSQESKDSKGQAIVNGHQENSLARVKQEMHSTPPLSLDTDGDSNNNIKTKNAPLLTNMGSVSLSTVTDSSSEARTESTPESIEGRLSTAKREGEPLSPIPALVPVGGQTVYAKRTPSQSELNSNKQLDFGQPSIKGPIHNTKETEQVGEMKASCGSSEVKVNSSECKPALSSGAHIKQENESGLSTESAVSTLTDVKEDAPGEYAVQSLSDDEEVGAMNNLLGDISQIQDDLEGRMDEIERQLEVLEDAYGDTPQPAKKTDFRKLVKDLSRVRRILQQVS